MPDKRNKQLIGVIVENSADWLEQIPVVLGDLDGNVDAGGALVYFRYDNGVVGEALNYVAPLIFDLHVLVGRNKAQPGYLQVISVRETYVNPVSNFVRNHHEQHEFPAIDTVWIDRKQIMPLTILVNPDPPDGFDDNFTVRVFGNVAQTATGIQLIETQDIDLSSYVPTNGAKYVSFEVDDDGVITIHDGTEVGSAELLTEADIPAPEPGKYFIGYALLYETQAQLTNENIRAAFPLGVIPTGTGYQISTAEEDTPDNLDLWGFWDVTDEELKSITYEDLMAELTSTFDTLYANITHAHVHGLERWNGVSGQTTFELSEIVASINSLSLNGLEEDPVNYYLSSDGTQIVLDIALPADMLVIAKYTMELL